jgi:hypothetical protein
MKTFLQGLGAVLLITLLTTCGGTTKVTGSWAKPGNEPTNYKKVVVLGIGANSVNRRIFEDQVETRLEAKGYPVIAALDLLPPNAAIGTITREIVFSIFESADIDAVFTMSLRHQEDTRRYVPAQGTYYTPYYSTMGFYDYYSGFGTYYYSPGYYTGSVQVFLEANFFDLETNELIWSAQTKSTDVASIETMAVQFADAIVADFISKNVLPAPPGTEEKKKK